MSTDYFDWSTLSVGDLRNTIEDQLAEKRFKFWNETQDLHDTDERFAARFFLDGLKEQVRSWCEHFDLPFEAVQGYDRVSSPGAPAGPMSWHALQIDYSQLAVAIATGVSLASADSIKSTILRLYC